SVAGRVRMSGSFAGSIPGSTGVLAGSPVTVGGDAGVAGGVHASVPTPGETRAAWVVDGIQSAWTSACPGNRGVQPLGVLEPPAPLDPCEWRCAAYWQGRYNKGPVFPMRRGVCNVCQG